MSKSDIFLTITSLALIYLVASSTHSYGLKLVASPQTKAMSKPTASLSPIAGSYLTKEERDEYKIYLIEQENETSYMYWDEWKLSKVFEKTLIQLEKEQNER
ncbi:MAG TPA: hypothetical protein EYG21_01505 [Nitrospinaceae bacterium]|nr:hypothetical protein [Nitrospinaceae bacterium]